MSTLSDEEFEKLELRLRQSGIKQSGLYHDLLDHFYCLTTVYMERGKSFPEALREAEKELAPDGFSTLEHEVSFYLTFDFQLHMNRLLYGGAFVAAVGQTLYVLFRTLHWPYAETFLVAAIFALFFLLIPGLILQYRENRTGLSMAERIRFFSGLGGLALFGMGSAFKLMYWPIANAQILLGTALLALLFFPLYFYQMYRRSLPGALA